MNPRVRVIRFARVTEPALLAAGEIVAHVWLDETAHVTGQILRTATGWLYQLGGGSPTGLASNHSRQDIERQIVLYHLGAMPVAATAAEPAPVAKTWFAQAS